MLLGSALVDTWASVHPPFAADSKARDVVGPSPLHARSPSRLARLLLALAVGLLLPLSGVVILLVGQTILVLRLVVRDEKSISGPPLLFRNDEISWGAAFRAAASKWGLAASMIAFAWTLQDRIAEIGARLQLCTLAGAQCARPRPVALRLTGFASAAPGPPALAEKLEESSKIVRQGRPILSTIAALIMSS